MAFSQCLQSSSLSAWNVYVVALGRSAVVRSKQNRLSMLSWMRLCGKVVEETLINPAPPGRQTTNAAHKHGIMVNLRFSFWYWQ
ncbi:unnamed protein product [Ixodes pacificus]